MAEVTETTEIARSRDRVWASLADFPAISAWALTVDHSEMLTTASTGVGATRRVQIGRNVLLERVVEWESDHTIAYEFDGLPGFVRSASNTWHLAGSGAATTVTLTSRVDAGTGPLRQAIGWVAARAMGRVSRDLLSDLKTYLEEVSS